MEKGGTVFVIIDVQDSLLEKCINKDILVDRITIFAKFCNIMKLPIILTAQYPKGLGPINNDIKEHLPEISPIAKTYFSCFGSKEFEAKFLELNPKNIIISGIEAHICVYQTASDAIKRGYKVYILEDCVSSRTQELRRIGIERLRDEGGIISCVEMAMYEIMGSSEIPEFKSGLKLVKGN